jgi:hypothetical protein
MGQECDGNHPGREAKVGPYDLSQCRLCWNRLNAGTGVAASVAASTNPQPVTRTPYSGPCRHLGGATGELVECPSCPLNPNGKAKTSLKLFTCAKHGRCTTHTPASEAACCKTCADREDPLPAPDVRNLLYHVYPIPGGVWRYNVSLLLPRIGLFNGRRVVTVVTDHHTEDPSEVERAFSGEVDEFIRLQNRPELREVHTFELLFSRVQSRRPGHATFYGHAKGVTRKGHPQVMDWTRLLYETNLDYWPAVEELLGKYPVVGSFKKTGRGWPVYESLSEWHYSGSFFWFRNRELFSKPDWFRIDRFWSGIEPYPSLHWSVRDAGCLFMEGPVPSINLYDSAFVRDIVVPSWEGWKAANSHRRTVL